MKLITKIFKSNWPFLIIFLVTVWAFWPFFSQGKIPVAGDILLGQYYPWLDTRWDNRITNYPVLNSTIPDSIFSFYPWKLKAIESLKNGALPIYDPNTYMGHQLFATGTTGIFYPLNIVFALISFNFGWGLLAASTSFLSSLFFYLWLRNKGLEKIPVLITSLAFGFSAFIGLQVSFINTSHSVLWLPLVLFTIDKLLKHFSIRYFLLLIFSLFASLNAGFYQGSLYLMLASFLYAVYFSFILKKRRQFLLILLAFIFPIILSAFQILPFTEVVGESNRIANYGASGERSEIFEFFVPFEFLITSFFPDFFGNPGKANYFGGADAKAWVGYFEFNNFSGTLAMLAFFPGLLLIKKQKEVLFFLILLIGTLIFATPNPVATLPYVSSIPIISSLVPSRILVLTQFSVLVIAAFGLNAIFLGKIRLRSLVINFLSLSLFYVLIILISYLHKEGILNYLGGKNFNWSVSFRNTVIPAAYLSILGVILIISTKLKLRFLWYLVLFISCFELIKQTSYFRPFISPELIYPKTPTITFLEENLNGYRMMINKQDLIPTNSQLIYNLKIVDGEGPIYPKNHGDFIGAINSPDFRESLPQFRRMIYFRNHNTPPLGLLNVKYVVSSDVIDNPDFKLVFEEGSTKIYENSKLLERAWSSDDAVYESDPLKSLKLLVAKDFDPVKTTIIKTPDAKSYSKAEINSFTQNNNEILFNSKSEGESLVVVSEQFYPGWRLYIDGQESKPFPADFNLIGLKIPEGDHQIKLVYEMPALKYGTYISLLSLSGLVVLAGILKYKKIN